MAQNYTGGANRGFWSMFPLTRASHFGTGFLSHSQIAPFETVVETVRFVGFLRRIIMSGCLRWREMDFVHPQYHLRVGQQVLYMGCPLDDISHGKSDPGDLGPGILINPSFTKRNQESLWLTPQRHFIWPKSMRRVRATDPFVRCQLASPNESPKQR